MTIDILAEIAAERRIPEVVLQPGWLAADIERARKRLTEWGHAANPQPTAPVSCQTSAGSDA